MDQPIFELEIVDEIMQTVRKANIGYYQRELSYSHCEVVNILEKQTYRIENNLNLKKQQCNASLPFCNGNYLIPLLMKLRHENELYYDSAMDVLEIQFLEQYKAKTICIPESFLEQVFYWVEEYIERHNEKLSLKQIQLALEFRLRSVLENDTDEKIKQKINA